MSLFEPLWQPAETTAASIPFTPSGGLAETTVEGALIELDTEKLAIADIDDATAATTHAASDKATPVDADEMPLVDSAASWVLKKLTWANIKATLSSVFAVLAGKTGGQTLIGGTGVTDKLVLQGTSGNGTSTATALELKVGNNGAASALTVLNNGYFGFGQNSPEQQICIKGGGLRFNFVTLPIAPSAVLAGQGAGSIPNGTYYYKISFMTSVGESAAGTASSSVTVSDNTVNGKILLTVPVSNDPTVTGRIIYRSSDNITFARRGYGSTITDNTTTTFLDNYDDFTSTSASTTSNDSGAFYSGAIKAALFNELGYLTVTKPLAVNGGRSYDNEAHKVIALGVGISTEKTGIYVSDAFSNTSNGALFSGRTTTVAQESSNILFGAKDSFATVNILTSPCWAVNMVSSVSTSSKNAGSFRSQCRAVNVNSTGTSYGYVCHLYLQDDGTAAQRHANHYGFVSFSQNAVATCQITSLYDFAVISTTGAANGVNTNRYALYIDYTVTGVTNAWGIYQTQSAVNNHFNGKIGVGVVTAAAKAHVIATTEQLRLGYDASNYASFTVDSAGNLTLANTGTTPSVYIATLRSGFKVTAVTTPASPAATDSGTVYTNEGDADGAPIMLPTAVAGLQFTAYVQTAQTLTITAGSGDTIRVAGNVTAAAGSITSAVVGSSVTLMAVNSTEWIAVASIGSWSF